MYSKQKTLKAKVTQSKGKPVFMNGIDITKYNTEDFVKEVERIAQQCVDLEGNNHESDNGEFSKTEDLRHELHRLIIAKAIRRKLQRMMRPQEMWKVLKEGLIDLARNHPKRWDLQRIQIEQALQ